MKYIMNRTEVHIIMILTLKISQLIF